MSASLKAVVTVEIAQTYCLRSSRQNRAKLRVKLGVLLKAGPRPSGPAAQGPRRPFSTPNPDADLWMRLDLPLDKKTVENQDRANGPPGLRASGPRAGGPSGRWAAGLILAKPVKHACRNKEPKLRPQLKIKIKVSLRVIS